MKRAAFASVVVLAVSAIWAANLFSEPADVLSTPVIVGDSTSLGEALAQGVRAAEQRKRFPNLTDFARNASNAEFASEDAYLRLQFVELMAAKAKRMTMDQLREEVNQHLSAKADAEMQGIIEQLRSVANKYPETIYAEKAKSAIQTLKDRRMPSISPPSPLAR